MGMIVPIVFWAMIVKLWLTDGPKVPLVFIGIWVACVFAFPFFGINGIFFFVLQTIMAVLLLAVDKYQSAMMG